MSRPTKDEVRKRHELVKQARDKGLTYAQIGKLLGVSGSRAREIHKDAVRMERLRRLYDQEPETRPWCYGLDTLARNHLLSYDIYTREDAEILLDDRNLLVTRKGVLVLRVGRQPLLLSLRTVNLVRELLGKMPLDGPPTPIQRACSLLESAGWTVIPPKENK